MGGGGGAATGLALLLVGVAAAAAGGDAGCEGLANVTVDPSTCNAWVDAPGGWPSFDRRGNLRTDLNGGVWVPLSDADEGSEELRLMSDPLNDYVVGTSPWRPA